jgi:hypothetical protein
MQQALPGPLAGSAIHLLPGVKVFKEWDGKDGVTGKRVGITRSMDTMVQALLSLYANSRVSRTPRGPCGVSNDDSARADPLAGVG